MEFGGWSFDVKFSLMLIEFLHYFELCGNYSKYMYLYEVLLKIS